MFPISREPWWFFSCHTGRRTPDNPAALVPAWNDPRQSKDWLMHRMGLALKAGAGYCMANRVMGGDGLSHVTAASWFTLAEHQRDALAYAVGFYEKVALVPFFGSMMRAKDDLTGWRADLDREVELLLAPGPVMDDSLATMQAWDRIGVKHFVIDNAAADHKPTHFVGRADRLAEFGIMLAGEAIPLTPAGRANPHLILRMPWIATDTFIQSRPALLAAPFDPETTRLYVWLNGPAWHYGTELERAELARDYCRRGFIPITDDRVMFDVAMGMAKGAA